MPDRPIATTATHAVLYAGYASPGVAATVGFISDGQRRVVTDPGMVRHRSVILLGRRLLAIRRPGCPAPATIGGGIAMTKRVAHPSGTDTFQKDTRPGTPTQLQVSFRLWLVAVAAGLFETALVVVDASDGGVGSAAQVTAGVAVRLLVFAAAVYLATQLRRGKNWARVALAVGLGGIGTLSLVIGPATWLAEGGSLTDAVAAADLGSALFAASRVLHLGAVIGALILMFHPAANAYIRGTTTRAPARRGSRQPRSGGATR